MLLSFSVSNFGSIGPEGIELNMAATADTLLPNNIAAYDGNNYIRGSFIYGANGSGKSTVIRALRSLYLIIATRYDLDESYYSVDSMMVMPHRFHRDTPTIFDILMEFNGIRYSYSLSILDNKIIDESLYYSPNGRMTKLFTRDENSFLFCKEFEKIGANCTGYFNDSRPILSIASNVTDISPIKLFRTSFLRRIVFLSGIHGNSVPSEILSRRIGEVLYNDPEKKKKIIELMNIADIDVEDIIVTPIERESRKKSFNDLYAEWLSKKDKREKEIRTITEFKIFFLHKNGIEIPLIYESDGTRSFLFLLNKLLDVLNNDLLLISDEPESHLHPNLIVHLMKFFFSNPGHSQIVCATHNTDLMNLKLLRRDQIFFTDLKYDNSDRVTTLYALSDFNGIRNNDANIRAKYLKGYFGAIPKMKLESSDIEQEDDDE